MTLKIEWKMRKCLLCLIYKVSLRRFSVSVLELRFRHGVRVRVIVPPETCRTKNEKKRNAGKQSSRRVRGKILKIVHNSFSELASPAPALHFAGPLHRSKPHRSIFSVSHSKRMRATSPMPSLFHPGYQFYQMVMH